MAGGNRYGAGRPGWHAKAEHCLRIDVRQFKQRGLLFTGASFGWHWTHGHDGEPAGSIGVRVEQSQLALQFAINGTNAGHTVELDRTACTLGGWRTWFRCPHCHRRCLVLYLRGGSFRCRLCGRVAYTSQSEDVIGRSWRRQRRIEARLGPDGTRPRCMHHATYSRLLERLWACEEAREAELDAVLMRLGFPGGAW